jgi:hypothetical protein
VQHSDDGGIGMLSSSGAERRRPVRVGGIRVRAEVQQELNNPRAVLRRGMVQGRAIVLVPAHACPQERRVMRDELAHITLSTEGDRGPETELGAVGEEIRRHVFTNSRQASGPAEHANLVVVALADDIGTCFDQESDDVQICSFRGEMQGIGVVAVVADANIRAALEQQPHAVSAIAPSRHVQCRPPPEVATPGVDQVEMGIEQSAKLVDLALLGGIEHRVERPFYHGGTMAARLEIARKQLDRVVAPRFADLVDGAAVIISEARIESALEGAANSLNIAGAGGGEHSLAGDVIDMGLERPPARKAVVARDRELDLGELGARLLRSQSLEALLRFVFRCSTLGCAGSARTGRAERGCSEFMITFLPSAPVVRVSRAGSQVMLGRNVRWAEPFTRTVGRRRG